MSILLRDALYHTDAAEITLGQAFTDDPAFVWLLGGDDVSRQARIQRFFAVILPHALNDGLVFTSANSDAVAIWRKPGEVHPGFGEFLRTLLPFLRVFRSGVLRGLQLENAMRAHHPIPDDFYYLQFVGVSPASQGKGLGRSVIQAGIQRAEAEGLPVVLETAKESNVSIYRRMGFEVLSEWQAKASAPPFWTMLRQPF